MSLTLELPSPIGAELIQEAAQEGVSEADRAALFVCLAAALLHETKSTPFQDAVKHFLAHRALNAEQVAFVIEELVNVCLEAPSGQGKTAASLEAARRNAAAPRNGFSEEEILLNLRDWRNAFVHQTVTQMPETIVGGTVHEEAVTVSKRDIERTARAKSIRGKYAHTVFAGSGSEELQQERQRDKQQEEAQVERRKR